MTKVLLIEPNSPEENPPMRLIASIGGLKANIRVPPYDLMWISGLLNAHNIQNKILDALVLGLSWKELEKEITKEMPEIVIFTTTVFSIENDIKVAKIVKQISQNIKCVPINHAMESSPFNLLEKFPDIIDIVPFHEHEISCLEYIKSNYNPEKTSGIYYMKNGKIIRRQGGYTKNLNDLGVPNQDGIKMYVKKYRDFFVRKHPFTVICCTRGCINQCHHCTTYYLNPLRYRSVDNVIKELKIASKYVKSIVFWDCEIPFERNGTQQKWIRELCGKIKKEKLNLKWVCNARADCVNYEILKLMKESGCTGIKLGADSNNQEILNNMNKNENVEDIEQAAKNIKILKLDFMTYCTMGMKGETTDTMLSTINWIINVLKPDFSTFSISTPIKGTVFYNYLKENGYLENSKESSEWDPIKLPVYSYPDFSSKEMHKLQMMAWKKFYLRPSYIFKRFISLHNLNFSIKNLPNFFENFIKNKNNGE